MTNYRPLYAIDATEPDADGRVDVRLTVVNSDAPTAVRTFDADVALYGVDAGVELADWIAAVVRDLYVSSAGQPQQTDDQTRWIDR